MMTMKILYYDDGMDFFSYEVNFLVTTYVKNAMKNNM